MKKKLNFMCSLMACLAGPPAAFAGDSAALSRIANADHRSEAHCDRNQYRHPVATLACGDENRAIHLEIRESDRLTLLFLKFD